jgi:hypothetical protein
MSETGNRERATDIDTIRKEHEWLRTSFLELLSALEMKQQGTTSATVTRRSSGISSDPIERAIAKIRDSDPRRES